MFKKSEIYEWKVNRSVREVRSPACDNVNEVREFFGDGRWTGLQSWCESSDLTNHRRVSNSNNQSSGRALQSAGAVIFRNKCTWEILFNNRIV